MGMIELLGTEFGFQILDVRRYMLDIFIKFFSKSKEIILI